MDERQYAPATQRNRGPILAVLQTVLPAEGTILEVSSGTGEHGAFFAPALSPRYWLPSDCHPFALKSIAAWRAEHPTATLLPPVSIDAMESPWVVETDPRCLKLPITAIVNINMIHIAPWKACEGLMAGASRILPVGGILYLYGPFKQGEEPMAPSNVAFDQSLRDQNPAWGVRDLGAVIDLARTHHLHWKSTVPMPANNFSVIWEKKAPPDR